MANKKWNELEQGAKRRRSNQGTRGSSQPAASNPNKNRKSTDTNRNSGRPAAAKPAPKPAAKPKKQTTVQKAKQSVTYYTNKNKGTAAQAANRLSKQKGTAQVLTGKQTPLPPKRATRMSQTLNPMEQLKTDAKLGPRYWTSRATVPSKPLTAEQQKKKNQQTAKQSGFNARARRQTLSQWDRNLPGGPGFQVAQAKQRFDEAKARGDMDAAWKAHREAESIRNSYGYSGGITGNEHITAKLSQDERNRLNKAGEEALGRRKLQYESAKAMGDRDRMDRAHQAADVIRGAKGYQDNRLSAAETGKGWGYDGEGRRMWAGTKEQNAEDARRDLAAAKSIPYGLAGKAVSAYETHTQAHDDMRTKANMEAWRRDADDYVSAKNDLEYYDNYVQTFGEPPDGMNRNVLVMRLNNAIQARAQLNRMWTDPQSAWYDATQARRLGTPDVDAYSLTGRGNLDSPMQAMYKAGTHPDFENPEPTLGDRLLGRRDELVEEAMEGRNGADRALTELALSIEDSAPKMAASLIPVVGPALSALWFGIDAYGDKAYELKQRGVPSEERALRGFGSGLIEAGTNVIPVGHFADAALGRLGENALKTIGVQSAEEALQEGASYGLNALSDYISGDPEATFSLGELAKNMAMGAASGAVFGTVGSFVSSGRDIPPEAQAHINDIDRIMEQSRQYEEMVRQGALSAEEGAAIQSQLQQDLVGKMQSIQDHVRTIDDQTPLLQVFEDGMQRNRERSVRAPAASVPTPLTVNETPVSVNPVERAEQMTAEALRATDAEMARRDAVAQLQAETRQQVQQPVSRLEGLASTFGESGAASLRTIGGKMVTGQGAFVRDFTDVYNQVLGGRSESQVSRPAGMSDANYFAAVTAAQNDRKTGWDLDILKASKAAGRNVNAGVDWRDQYVRQMDRKTARTVDGLAKALGVKVVFAEKGSILTAGGARANAEITGNVVRIEKDNPNPVRMLIGHELTHRMQDVSPETYRAFRDYAMSVPGSMDALERTVALYQEAGAFRAQDNARQMAMDEVAADFAGSLLENSEQLREFIRRNYENRTMLEVIRDFFRDLAAKLTGRQKAQADEAVRLLEEAISGASKQLKQSDRRNRQNVNKRRLSLGGMNAQTSDIKRWSEAQKMERDGKTEEEIRQATGWLKGPDGKWRFEISDEDASFDFDANARRKQDIEEARDLWPKFYERFESQDRPDAVWDAYYKIHDMIRKAESQADAWFKMDRIIRDLKAKGYETDDLQNLADAELDRETNPYADTELEERTLADYLDHPALFQAYPELRDTMLRFADLGKGTNGQYNPQDNEILLNKKLTTEDEVLDTLSHEVQHAIQHIEGFAFGASPEYWETRRNAGWPIRTKGEQKKLRKLREKLADEYDENKALVDDVMRLNRITPTVPRGEVDWDTLEQIEEDPPEWQEFDRQREALEAKYGDMKVFDLMELVSEIERLEKGTARTPRELYWMTAGEVEAREVADRREMTNEERRKNPPKLGGDDVVFANGARFSITSQTESPEFKQWFGDWQNDPAHASKVVNEDGTPKVVYHQTGEDFTIFDPRHKGAGTSDNGTPFGIFLKSSDSNIGLRGGKQMALYANIRNPLVATNREDLARQARKMSPEYSELLDQLNALDAEYHAKHEAAKQALSDFMSEWRKENPNAGRRALWDVPQFTELFDAEDVVVEEWVEKASELSQQAKETLTRALRENGYDGVILREDSGSFGRRTDAFIALDAEQVKSATDNAGTFDRGNPDIRYSIGTHDSEGYTLTKGQREYFKDSQVTDERGRLLRVYHGTPAGGFTEFREANNTGYFFTRSRSLAQTYSGGGDEFAPERAETWEDAQAMAKEYGLELFEENGGWTLKHSWGEEFFGPNDLDEAADSILKEAEGERMEYVGYLNLTNPLVVEGHGAYWNKISGVGADGHRDRIELWEDLGKYHIRLSDEMDPEMLRDMEEIKASPEELREILTDYYAEETADRIIDDWIEAGFSPQDFELLSDADGYETRERTTLEWVWDAVDGGYDGVIFHNIIDEGRYGGADEVTDVYVALDSNQFKSVNNWNPTEDEDIRYSIGTEGYDRARLMRENQQLKEKLDYWRGQVKKSDRTKADPKEVRKLANSLRTDYSTDMDAGEITQRLQAIYDGIGKDWSYDRAYEEAGKLARDMIEQATATDDYLYAEYEPMRKFFQDTPLVVTPEMKRAIPDYNEWRKPLFGKLRLQSGAETNVDRIFQEAVEKWPEWFNEEVDNNSVDQLERIAEVMDSVYKRDEVNPFEDDMSAPAGYLATEIMDMFWDVPAVKKTFADRMQNRLDRQIEKTNQVKEQGRERVQAEREKGNARVRAERERGAQRVQAVREQRDRTIAKLRADHKEKYEKALQKAREQREQALKKQSERYLTAKKKRSQQQKERELRAKIQRHVNKLSTKLTRPTDTQHIPEALVDTVRSALESINLASKDMKATKRTQAFEALRKMYQEMDTNGSEVVIDPDLLPNISDIIGFADTPIDNLGLEDLNTIWNTVKAIETSISTFNKALGRAKFETISQPAFGIRDYLTGRKDRGDYRGPFRQMDKLLNFNMLIPEAYFLRMGNSGKEVFRMLRDAQDRHITIMDQAQRKTREIIGKTDIRKLEKEKHTFTFDGETVELTAAQIMSLHELMKRQQAVDHVMIGGVRPESVKNGIKDLPPARPWHLTQDQVSKVVDSLTEEQVKLADELQKYMGGTMAELGNEASMEVYGYRKFTEKHYFPISVDKNQTQSDVKNDAVSGTIAGWGSARPVKPNANNAVILRSIFDVYADHVTEMANYASWLAPMENMNRIFNFRYKDAEGNPTGTFKDQLEKLFGRNGAAYWKQLQADLNNGVHGRDDSPFSAFMGTYKASAIGANIRVIAQQPTAILRALDSINPADFVAGMAKARIGKFDKVVKQYAPIAIWKDWGYFQQDTGRQMRNVLFNDDTLLQRANSAMMWGAGKADSLSWTAIWNALESETRRKRKDLRYKSKEFYKAVAERFNEVVDHTQVVDGILQRSQIMRSADGLTKMATSFMAEPTKTYNMMLSAIYEARNAKGRDRTAAMGRLARTVFALTVSITVNAAAQALVDAIRDDDKDEDYWEKFIQAYFGLEGETRKEQIKNGILNGNLEAAFNPLTYIPYLKDIISQTQGYTVSRMDMDTISRVLKAFTNVEKAMSGEGKNTKQSAWLNLTAEIARFLGIPAANIKRDIQTITRTFFAGTGNYRMLYEQEKFLYDVTSKNTLTEFSKLILGAERAGDEESAQAIRQDMIDSGVDAEKIDKKLAELRKKAVTDTEEYQTALSQKTDAYHTILEADERFGALESDQQENVRKQLDSYAQYQVLGENMDVDNDKMEKIAEAESHGVPAADWVVFKAVAKEIHGDDRKEQVLKLIDSYAVSNEGKSYMYLSQNYSEKANPYQ